MVKKEAQEKSRLEESRNIVEPVDAEGSEKLAKIDILVKEGADEYKETPPADQAQAPAAAPYSREKSRFMRAEEKDRLAREESLAKWKPKTKLGAMVRAGEIKTIEEVFDKGLKILEPQIVDLLIPDLKNELMLIGQAKGKFGGGKRRFWRQTQKKTAEAFIARLNKKGKWGAPIVTEVKKAGQYWKAEEDHQDYLEKRPNGYTCHFLRPESILGD